MTNITVKQTGNHITVHGDLNLKTARQAFQLMPSFPTSTSFPRTRESLKDGDENEITVDLTEATNPDSSALALLVHWSNRAHDTGTKIKFKGASPQLQQLAKITNLSDLF